MKRIIGGKTYNTETATRLAEAVQHPQDDALFDDLYLTRHGAFFRYSATSACMRTIPTSCAWNLWSHQSAGLAGAPRLR